MRTRKPAAPAKGGPACHRCTALLHAGIERCSMCGWPAGVGYPPVEGELELAKSPVTEPEQEVTHADEQAGAQLDALAGMAQRRNEPLPVRDDATASLERVPALDEVPTTEAPTEPGASVATDATDAVEHDDTDAEVDPLTAPIEALTEPGEPTSAAAPSSGQAFDEDLPAVTDTPLADVAAQVVAAGADTAPNEEPLQVDDEAAPLAPEAPTAPPRPDAPLPLRVRRNC
jgi:hypothetical protein